MCSVNVVSAETKPAVIPMRKSTPGPEIEIVKIFIKEYMMLAKARSWKHDVLILVEPRVGSGYPDLVIAHYAPDMISGARKPLQKLARDDFKILAYLMNSGASSVDCISSELGYPAASVEGGIRRLGNRGLLHESRIGWKAAQKSSFFAIERLIAVEAKVHDTSEALAQAFANTRFASLSYSLLGTSSMSERLKGKYEKLGVGAVTIDPYCVMVPPQKRSVPINSTTLMINEWICNSAVTGVAAC